jgi:C-terminal processing protease CtpA/Prc
MRTLLVVVLLLIATVPASANDTYVTDVHFALTELEKNCGRFFELKKIDWPAVSKQFIEESKKVKTDEDHLVLLTRLLARLNDGHAQVRPLAKGKAVKWPEHLSTATHTGPGLFLCRIGDGLYVKSSFAAARNAGVRPGAQVVKIDGKPARDWLAANMQKASDLMGFSTDQQALYRACHWGLGAPAGTKLTLELKDPAGRMFGTQLIYQPRVSTVPEGPAVFAPQMKGNNDVRWTTLKSGFGYVHVRRCPGNLPEIIDEALAAVGDAPGMILDFRANGGGGFDHNALMGRFIPEGKAIRFAKAFQSAGPKPYGGPVVVIIDAGVRSAGETAAGMFKEDGRAYMIGESPTAGMSSGKTTIDLPSGLFALYVSVSSNMGRFNNGKGIEGIGVPPHEIVGYDPKDLASGIYTLTRRAEQLLEKFPQEKVPYNPRDFGWNPPK